MIAAALAFLVAVLFSSLCSAGLVWLVERRGAGRAVVEGFSLALSLAAAVVLVTGFFYLAGYR